MSNGKNPDDHFRTFASWLELEIAKYGESNQEHVERQKVQLETLLGLEADFRRELIEHRSGPDVYKDFIGYLQSSGSMIMNPFGKAKVKAALNGNHAQLRITNTSPVFEVGLPSDVNAADQLVLIKLNPKSDRREVEVGRVGITGSSSGYRKEAIVATTFEEVKPLTAGSGVRYMLYRVKLVSPLPPGEYAFAPRNLYYDFGVDTGQ